MELEARTAIARLLRSKGPLDRQLDRQLHRQLLDRLACLFDPNPRHGEQRKIRIEGRRPGELTDYIRNTQIADHIWDEVKRGQRATAAVESAAEKFALSKDRVWQIWRGYRPLMEK